MTDFVRRRRNNSSFKKKTILESSSFTERGLHSIFYFRTCEYRINNLLLMQKNN